MTMPDTAAHARMLLEANSYVVLATADADGNPWATPVWYANDDLDRLLWLSWPGSRHSQLLRTRPRIALTVFDSTAAPNQGAAVYATATAGQCPQDQLDDRLRTINRRAETQGLDGFSRDRVTGDARLRLYVAELDELWVLDQDAPVDQRASVAR